MQYSFAGRLQYVRVATSFPSPAASRPSLAGEHAFIRYLIARCFGTLAVQMQTVAVGWQVYDITRDPLDLGLIGLSQFLPFILLILPAGHAADHYDRRRILTSCYFLNMAAARLPARVRAARHARRRCRCSRS